MNKNIKEDEFIKVVNESVTMAEASVKLGLHFNTFKRYALKFGVYNPNQGAKGKNKKSVVRVPTDKILNGEYPQFQTFKLKNRLFKEGILKNKCSICGVSDWNDKPINCELDHIDGNRTNHRIDNLRILCPNCHSQTETYRSKNRG
jgi:5-methylcytosine-specific restriction endonuclease McrA